MDDFYRSLGVKGHEFPHSGHSAVIYSRRHRRPYLKMQQSTSIETRCFYSGCYLVGICFIYFYVWAEAKTDNTSSEQMANDLEFVIYNLIKNKDVKKSSDQKKLKTKRDSEKKTSPHETPDTLPHIQCLHTDIPSLYSLRNNKWSSDLKSLLK